MNVLIPMAGAGSRFIDAGYDLPKPLIDVCGKPMIGRVIDSLDSNKLDVNFIFVAQNDHLDMGLRSYLEDKGRIVTIDRLTEGAACTTLLAKDLIDNDDELVIANCDQFLQWSFYNYITYSRQYDGCLVIFNSTNPHHSYAKVRKSLVTKVAEKVVISDKASAGIYYYKNGSEYVKYAEQMIEKDIRTNNEFYICPMYNEMIESFGEVSTYQIDVYNKHMLGTPEELQIFLDKIDNEEVKI